MIENPELGYTPRNLKAVRKKLGLTQQKMADLTKTNLSSYQRWETDVERESHSDMPLEKWLFVLQILAE